MLVNGNMHKNNQLNWSFINICNFVAGTNQQSYDEYTDT